MDETPPAAAPAKKGVSDRTKAVHAPDSVTSGCAFGGPDSFATQREKFAREIDQGLAEIGIDGKVNVYGARKDQLRITWVLINRVWINAFAQPVLIANLEKIGFKKIVFGDGFCMEYTVTLSPEDEAAALAAADAKSPVGLVEPFVLVSPLEARLNVTVERLTSTSLCIRGKTNLPDGTRLDIGVTSKAHPDRDGDTDAWTTNGEFRSAVIDLVADSYVAEVMMALSAQTPEVAAKLSADGSRLTGPLVTRDGGVRVRREVVFTISLKAR